MTNAVTDKVTGRIEARFSRNHHATHLAHSYCAAPLKIAKTFPLAREQVGVCIMDCSPGLLAGDHYQMQYEVGQRANVFLTTQSFTRVHPSRDDPASQQQHIHVASHALLEYLPEPVMLYQDAAYRADCHITIEPGSVLLMSEIACAGRTLRGEVFQFHSYQNRLRVQYADELIFCQQMQLQPDEFNPTGIGAWENYTHWGSFYLFSDRVIPPHDAQWVQQLRQVMQAYPTLFTGVSLTYRYGLCVAMMGHRAWDLQQAVQDLRRATRTMLYGAGS